MLKNPLIPLLQSYPWYAFTRLLLIAIRGLETQLPQITHSGQRTRKMFDAFRLGESCRSEKTANMGHSERPFGNGLFQHNRLGAISDCKRLVKIWLDEVI